jgi:ubiquinone/menaquinone biosynthesis C-methylase UbiE
MSDQESVLEGYAHGNLLGAIEASLDQLGRTTNTVTIDDLAPVDEFHIGGRIATDRFLANLGIGEEHQVLDIGCGLGGAARFAAETYGATITGIDLSQEYIDTGNALNTWVELNERITLYQGTASQLPFDDESFDRAYMLHVGMNIEDKSQLFAEAARVLRTGATLGVYDVMRLSDGKLTYPVPWAAEERASSLSSPEEYKQALGEAGFMISSETSRARFALDFFETLLSKNKAAGGPPPLGLHTLMQQSTLAKLQNMIEAITAGTLAPTEIVAEKQ